MESATMITPVDLKSILGAESLEAHFQPVYSVREKSILGYEGLIRGFQPGRDGLIPPMDLFDEADARGSTLELDRLCRKRVLQDFRVIRAAHKDRLLFLNFNTALVDKGVVGSGNLLQQVKDAGLDPRGVALEIIESNVRDVSDLKRFIETYREHGFLVALDDVGAGHSNLNRIPLLKPDLLKVDRYLLKGIDGDFFKQEVFKSLVGLAHKIGAVILAEGVETQEEALTAIGLGADLVQGYHFSKPDRFARWVRKDQEDVLEGISRKYREKLQTDLGVRKYNLRKYEVLTREVQEELSKVEAGIFDDKLLELARFFPLVESLYVLDGRGIQVTEAVRVGREGSGRNPFVFRPSPKGSDHSMKDYFHMLADGGLHKTTFVSEAYLSLAGGNLCVTYSRLFKDALQRAHILCLDIDIEFLQKMRLS
jgi:EAL domain-containing protein (putative c-di-GMP-specific phosphodiesterase class I)